MLSLSSFLDVGLCGWPPKFEGEESVSRGQGLLIISPRIHPTHERVVS